MGERELTVRLENVNARAKETFAEIIRSVKGLELVDSKEHCSLLILEVGRDPEEDFRRINEIKESHEAKEIFLTAKEADTDLLIRALRTGVKEFFPQPLKREEVVEAFLKFIRKHVEEIWRKTKPEVIDRANSLVNSFEKTIQKIEQEIAQALAKGDNKKAEDLSSQKAKTEELLAAAKSSAAELK